VSTLTHYLCIGCPLGCRLEVEDDGSDKVQVRGYQCRRGKEFAEREHTDPRRMVTTTVRVQGGDAPRLPVKTREPIPKHSVLALCRELHAITVQAPVQLGDVILADALGLGVDVVATRSVSAPD